MPSVLIGAIGRRIVDDNGYGIDSVGVAVDPRAVLAGAGNAAAIAAQRLIRPVDGSSVGSDLHGPFLVHHMARVEYQTQKTQKQGCQNSHHRQGDAAPASIRVHSILRWVAAGFHASKVKARTKVMPRQWVKHTNHGSKVTLQSTPKS